MRKILVKSAVILAAFAATLPAITSVSGAPSTSSGQISVAQVMQMLEKAPIDRIAQQVLMAYLAGVGEAAGAVASMGRASCRAPLGLSSEEVREALKGAAGKPDTQEIPATPLIVRDMLDRAGCRAS